VINDTSNGGGEYFAVEDSTAARQPFRIEAGARVNALYVENDGDVGLGTNNPVVNMHIVDGNTPTVRLDQDGSQGFTPQVWDVAGNEANFFIRDVTNGSKLPFRITPNTPTSAIRMFTDHIAINDGAANYDTQIKGDNIANLFYVDAGNDKVGIGTDTPLERVHIKFDANTTIGIDGGAGLESGFWFYENGVRKWEIYKQGASDNLNFFSQDLVSSVMLIQSTDGFVGLRNTTPGFPLTVGTNNTNGNGAHVTVGGVWTNGSSREFKENIKDVAALEARDVVMNLKPVTYNYKLEPGEEYVGFIAEDVPDLVATSSRKYLSPMDIVSVVTKVVQDHQQTIERQQETILALSERLERLEGQSPAQD